MIYSYKEILHLDPPVRTDTFDTEYAENEARSNLEKKGRAAAITWAPVEELLEKLERGDRLVPFVKLGIENERHYISVPDGVDIGPQLPQCDVRKEDNIPHDIITKLITRGEYAQSQRELASMQRVSYQSDLTWSSVKNFADIYSEIRALSSVVSKLLAGTPALTSAFVSKTGAPSYELELIKEYEQENNKLNQNLEKLGL